MVKHAQLFIAATVGWDAYGLVETRFIGLMGLVYGVCLALGVYMLWQLDKPRRKTAKLTKAQTSIAAIEADVDKPLADVVASCEQKALDDWLSSPVGQEWRQAEAKRLTHEARTCPRCVQVRDELAALYTGRMLLGLPDITCGEHDLRALKPPNPFANRTPGSETR